MQIVRLQIKNFLSITDVEIRPGKVTQITGANNQGKTTVLKAIEFALKGSTDGSMVRHGTDQAEVIVEFDDQTLIHRRLKPTGSQSLSVASGDKKLEKPQQFLNQLFTTSTFNPLSLLDKDLRTEALLKCIPIQLSEADLLKAVGEDIPIPLPPLDYTQHGLKVADQAHRYFYQRRYEANKIAKDKAEAVKVKRAELPMIPILDPEYNREAVTQSLEVVKRQIVDEEAKSVLLRDRQQRCSSLEKRLDDQIAIKTQRANKILELEKALAEAKAYHIQAEQEHERLTKEYSEAVEALKVDGPDQKKLSHLNAQTAELNNMMTHIERRDSIKKQHEAVDALDADAKSAQFFADQLDAIVKKLGDEFKDFLLRQVDLPVAGLSYSEGQFSLEGSSIDNIASSKALRLAIGLARKLSAQTKLVCIDGAELLDQENYDTLRKEIENDGFTYFLTRVGEPFAGNDKVVRMEGGQIQ